MFDTFLAFTDSHSPLDLAYTGHHSGWLVGLSLLIACMAAFTSFTHGRLMRNAASAATRHGWHFSGALAMGLGVWAMHFTGMMAFELPVQVRYRADLTLLSIVPAVLAGVVALAVESKRIHHWRDTAVGGVLMGAGIGAMHYTGMAAMVLPAQRLYQPSLFAVSIVLAVALATLALMVRPLLRERLSERAPSAALSALLMGLAIASMHYVAMHATVFLPGPVPVLPTGPLMTRGSLGTVAVGVAVALLMGATGAVWVRLRLDRSQKALADTELRAQQMSQRLQQIAQRIPGLVYQIRLDASGVFTFPYASEAIRGMYGMSPDEAMKSAQPMLAAIHPDDRETVLASVYESARTLRPWRSEHRVVTADGQERWLLGTSVPQADENGVVWSGFITDISDRKATEATIERLAYNDPLTGLPNRSRMRQLLGKLRQQLLAHGGLAAVVFIDLDRFKQLNDTQGHQAGDDLLCQVANRLSVQVPTDTRLGRLSSDEFVLLVPRLPQDAAAASAEVQALAEHLMRTLQAPYDLNGRAYVCAVSVGACLIDNAQLREDELLKRADIAMSHAKRSGGGTFRFFDPHMDLALRRRFALEQALREAVDEGFGQFELHLQPQVSDMGQTLGTEALLRWTHPVHGAVSPGEFIPLAEHTGLIEPLGDWVLQQACALIARWADDPVLGPLVLSVNVSARQFYQPGFSERLQELLTQHGARAQHLMLELTEGLVLADLNDAVPRMLALKAIGLRFSMDDFGTGFSSLSYLAQLPFDEIKIDQSFVRQAQNGQRQRSWAIVEAIIGIADKFGIAILAEGVETEAQRQLLQQSGCHLYQGYLFARPEPVPVFEAWLKARAGGV